jgi:predicted secreted protein
LADDQNEQTQPDASQEAFGEIWWQNYIVQVNKSIAAAEQHLEVPAGTVSSIPHDPDFIATVMMYAVIEPILNDLLASWQKPQHPYQALSLLSARENFRAFVAALNIRGPTGKSKLV